MKRLIAFAALIAATPGLAVPTPVTVRVLSQGAKFIGTGMGGVDVVLADAATGAKLAEGRIEGGTGDTAKIMPGSPRGTPMADEKSAHFTTTIDISEPKEIRVIVMGPFKPAGVAVSKLETRWLVPGQPVVGDGWVIDLPGLALTAHRVGGGEGGQVVADVSMLCGCPIAPGTLWDEKRFEVKAWVGGAAVPMKWAGQTGRFSGAVPAGAIWVTAVDTLSGATSAAKITASATP